MRNVKNSNHYIYNQDTGDIQLNLGLDKKLQQVMLQSDEKLVRLS